MVDDNLFWESFQKVEPEPDVSSGNLVALDILEAFGIHYENIGGGYLKNVDIKRADALSVLKSALLESYAENDSSKLTEIHINADGKADFYEVGSKSSNLHPYYTIPSANYVKPKVSVMVTGGKPKQERIVPSTGWYPLIAPDNPDCTYHDATRLNSSCFANGFSTHAVITYRDPFRHNPNSSWNDGVKDLFELDPEGFDRFIGLSWRITPPTNLVTPYTKIYKQTQSSVPVMISGDKYTLGQSSDFPNLGQLKRRANRSYNDPTISDCKQYEDGENYCSASTVEVPITLKEGFSYETIRNGQKISKFLGVQGLFVVGIVLSNCMGIAKPGKQKLENNEENTALFVSSLKPLTSVSKLTEGTHYTILYPQSLTTTDPMDFPKPCIQFANNLRINDNAKIGTAVPFYIQSQCATLCTLLNANATYESVASILPLENGCGLLVIQVWAQVNLDTPSFLIIDPSGKAHLIAAELRVEVLPLILRDTPSPIAINGKLINQSEGIVDNDPTKQQDLRHTEMEKAYDEMGSGRTLSLSLASLDEDQTVRLSRKLYNLLAEDTGAMFTHTCPPTDDPVLGSTGPRGGIINVIEYSYTDQGSYLITVTEGPQSFGDFSGIDGGIYYKRNEEVSAQGTVVQDAGNHVSYLVHVDGIGAMPCINACGAVITVRDRVSITIHNNAVES